MRACRGSDFRERNDAAQDHLVEFRRPSDFAGLWTRSFLRRPDGSEDRATAVAWLQATERFVDLRQPAELPVRARSLRELDRAGLAALARQQGFAGTLVRDGDVYEWRREIDLQPAGPHRDRGRMHGDASTMIETGLEVDYVEHWHRAEGSSVPVLSLAAHDAVGVVLVRVGTWFMLARDRPVKLPAGASLADIVAAAADLGDAQDLVDLEISFGQAGDEWLIERSTLPWRCGTSLAPRFGDREISYDDLDARGATFRRACTIDAGL